MPDLLNILTHPDPRLRKMSAEVEIKDLSSKELKKLIADMKHTMIKKDGVGLAAPQVGHNIRLITINTDQGPICLINPKITKRSWARETQEEGCLSLPDVFHKISRHKKVCCKFTTELNKQGIIEAEGLIARGLQHEIDHLDGVLFIDYLDPKKSTAKKKK